MRKGHCILGHLFVMKTTSQMLGAYNSADSTFFLELILLQSEVLVIALSRPSHLIHHVFSSDLSLKHAIF